MTSILQRSTTPSFSISSKISLLLAVIGVVILDWPSITPAYAAAAIQTSYNLSFSSEILFLSLASGAIIGISLGLIGGGGSILAVPLLLYVVGIKDPHVAIGTSAIAVGATALINVVQLYRKGNVRLNDGIMFAIPGAIGSLIGSQLGLLTPSNGLLIMFAFLMVIVAVKMLAGKDRIKISKFNHSSDVEEEEEGEIKNNAAYNNTQRIVTVEVTTSEKRRQQWRLALTGLGVGLAAGYFGIGGGFLIVPALMYAAGLAISTAIGTSLVAVSSFGFMTALRYSFESRVNVPAALILIAGGIGGSILGTKIGGKLEKRTLTRIFGTMLIVVAVYMVAKSLAIL